MKRRKSNIVGIDLAANPSNPTGWALLEDLKVSAQQLFTDEEIVGETIKNAPMLVAIDAPLSLPKHRKEHMRNADKEMRRKGYPVLPTRFRSMEKLTLRAQEIALQLKKEGLAVIEVHPTSTRKALNIPTKEWNEIQQVFIRIGLKDDIEKHSLTPHEIDAVTGALTGYLYKKRKTELIGNQKEGYIVVPKKRDWRTLEL